MVRTSHDQLLCQILQNNSKTWSLRIMWLVALTTRKLFRMPLSHFTTLRLVSPHFAFYPPLIWPSGVSHWLTLEIYLLGLQWECVKQTFNLSWLCNTLVEQFILIINYSMKILIYCLSPNFYKRINTCWLP